MFRVDVEWKCCSCGKKEKTEELLTPLNEEGKVETKNKISLLRECECGGLLKLSEASKDFILLIGAHHLGSFEELFESIEEI